MHITSVTMYELNNTSFLSMLNSPLFSEWISASISNTYLLLIHMAYRIMYIVLLVLVDPFTFKTEEQKTKTNSTKTSCHKFIHDFISPDFHSALRFIFLTINIFIILWKIHWLLRGFIKKKRIYLKKYEKTRMSKISNQVLQNDQECDFEILN